MKLTGQAKEDFEKWFNRPESEEYDLINNLTNYDQSIHEPIDHFRSLTASMRYGVYVDWFDSVGIEALAYRRGESYACESSMYNDEYSSGIQYKPTMNEARTAAIEKANKYYNNTHK